MQYVLIVAFLGVTTGNPPPMPPMKPATQERVRAELRKLEPIGHYDPDIDRVTGAKVDRSAAKPRTPGR
jgi:hypothetical protein